MVGSLKPDGAVVWTRASADAKVSVLYATNPQLERAQETPQVLANAAGDFNAKVVLSGLSPGSDYWYATRLENPTKTVQVVVGPTAHFRTPPLPATEAPCRIAVSADVFDPTQFGMFDQIRAQAPDFYLSLGDFPYCDPATTLAEFRNKHNLLRSSATLQAFFRSLGSECVWDDHEVDDNWSGASSPTRAANGKAAWLERFPLPPGATDVYRTVRWGKGVELFVLDCRSKRGIAAEPDTPAKSMLGAVQKAWLFAALAASDAHFKVVATSMPLRYGFDIQDSWWYWQNERREIFDYLRAKRIENVIFVTADNHYMAAHHHREGFREYMFGPVAQRVFSPLPDTDPEQIATRLERNWGNLIYDPKGATLTVEAWGVNGLLYRDVIERSTPGILRVQSDTPECAWSSSGPFFLRDEGTDAVRDRVEPGHYSISFASLPQTAGPPLPVSVDVPAGGEVRVACSYRDAPSPNPVLFADGFGGPLKGYTIHDAETASLPSSWFTDNGYLYQSSGISDGNPISLGGTQAAFGSAAWTDYTLSVAAKSFDRDVFGIAFRWKDPLNHYRFALDSERASRKLIKVSNGVMTVLAQDRIPYAFHKWYALQAAVTGSRIRVALDGQVVFDVTDPTFASGMCALFTGANLMTCFDNVVVRQGDALGWYRSYLLHDDFGLGTLAGWSVRDSGTFAGPSAWSVVDGVCRQTSDIHTPETPPNDVSRPGTMLLRGKPGWTDYRFSARIRNHDDDGVGLVFRYAGPNDFYRFSWDRERSTRRLTRVVGGTWSVLRQDSVPFLPGRWYRIQCEAVGTTLRVVIDGALWTEVSDAAIPAGQVGLYCWRSDGAAFDDVEVEPATPLRPVIAATMGTPTKVRAWTLRGRGLPYILALSFGNSPGLALAQLHATDPRILALNLDQLFALSIAPHPLLKGFSGLVAPTGEIGAQIDAPALPSLAGTRYYLGGIVLNPSFTDVVELLPSIELVFPN